MRAGGGKCLCQTVDLAGYTCASFSWHCFHAELRKLCDMGTAVPEMNTDSCTCRTGWDCWCLGTLLRMTGSQDSNN